MLHKKNIINKNIVDFKYYGHSFLKKKVVQYEPQIHHHIQLGYNFFCGNSSGAWALINGNW